MKKLLTSFLVMIFVLTVFSGGVFAQGPNSHMGSTNNQSGYNSDRREYNTGYNRIELSEEQINEIADLREEFYNETEELREQFRDLNRELRDLEFRGASNAEIGEVEDRIEEVLIELDEKRISNQEKIESVLTEEQLNLADENRFNAQERYEEGFNNDFRNRSQRSYSRDGYSRFDNYFGHGMMGRGFSGRRYDGFRGGRSYNNRDFGYGPSYGPGWCH